MWPSLFLYDDGCEQMSSVANLMTIIYCTIVFQSTKPCMVTEGLPGWKREADGAVIQRRCGKEKPLSPLSDLLDDEGRSLIYSFIRFPNLSQHISIFLELEMPHGSAGTKDLFSPQRWSSKRYVTNGGFSSCSNKRTNAESSQFKVREQPVSDCRCWFSFTSQEDSGSHGKPLSLH